jgi:hypothetical protein
VLGIVWLAGWLTKVWFEEGCYGRGEEGHSRAEGAPAEFVFDKDGDCLSVHEREYDSHGMSQIENYGERTESKAEDKMPWTSRANEEIITRGCLAMRNRAMSLHPVGVSEMSDER